MSLALYTDEQIPSVIVVGLRERGIDVLTVQDDGQMGTSDLSNLRRSFELRRVFVTEDHDYERIAGEFWARGETFFGIAFMLRRGVSYGVLINELEMLASCLEVDEVMNRIIYIPLKS
jgi:hypothetical protein